MDKHVNDTGAESNSFLKVRREKLTELQNAGRDPFHIVKFDVDAHSADIHNNFDAMVSKRVTVAGRMMSRRVMGKSAFFDIQDKEGRIQVYIKNGDVAEGLYSEFIKWDIGDIIGVTGKVFRTEKGEISVRTESALLLSKCLQTFPEKYHGLQDQEARYRHRYVDLIVNPEVKDTFIKRSAIIKGIRDYLDGLGFMEVETPLLHEIAGGANARPFVTHHNTLNMQMFLRIALELPLKRLIVGGLERVYEIGRCFRNEGMSTRHNPEFTMIELYQAYTDYHGMMNLTETLLKKLALDITGSALVEYFGTTIDFKKPFERITMVDAVKKYSDVDFDKISTLEQARAIAQRHDIEYKEFHGKGEILNLFFEKYAEKNLIQPTFLMDHPVEISYLCKKKPDKPDYAERFELFILGREYANAYSELNDPVDQRERFMRQESLREAGDEEANAIDEDFLLALEYGMPPTGGLGIGVDRLVMLLTHSASIRDVLFFPTMRPVQ